MSRYDVTPDEEPLDMTAVATDDAMVEQLRRSLSPDAAVIWDDDDELDDPALALLRGLQRDVAADLPQLPSILPREVTSLAGRRRGFGRGAAVAAVTAGVLSIAGVAAAQPGRPLSGVRTAVEHAVTDVVDAITPSAPVGPTTARPHRSPSGAASPTSSPRREAARAAAAAAEVAQALDSAQRFLDRGQTTAAQEQLDRATRALARLADPAVRGPLATRLAALNARLAGTETGHDANRSGKDDTTSGDNGKSGRGKDDSGTKGSSDSSGSGKDDSVGDPSGKSGSDSSGRTREASPVAHPEKSAGADGSHLRGTGDEIDPVSTDGASSKSGSNTHG
jgi:hypothetical protein